MHRARRPMWAAGILTLLAAMLPFVTATPVLADSGATVPAGFQDEVVYSGLDHPMSIVFAPNGNVFIAEKRGTILFYTNSADTTPTVFADLNTNVHNYWDRGLMGLAVDPGYPTRPYVYVLYAYNHILGDSSPAPRWPSADALDPPGSKYDDRCPNPPQGTADGCVISGRLSRLTAAGGVMTGSENVLVEDWCQQYPSHSLGSLVFGPEGALYASGGEGASFTSDSDYGQLGGTLDGTPTPVNPCGDPGGSNPAPPSAEGGALRAQDMRTPGDPEGLDGAVIRIDPNTGAAWPDNATFGQSDPNARRIIAYGLRNPYRFTIKPDTGDVWIGDVGWNTWEELNRLIDPDAAPRNFGWPCYEGTAVLPAYGGLGLSICDTLDPSDVTLPYYTYNHSASVVSGDGCGIGSSSISGLAFLPNTSPYPAGDHGALFMTDYTRHCIWELPAGSGGNPNVGARRLFANLNRPSGQLDGGSVFLTISPTGDLVYADYDRGEIRRIHYYGSNVPPVPSFTATPSFGPAPLDVDFDASATTDADHDSLTYAWDLDGDGQYDDATGVTTSRTYSGGDVDVGLQVSDGTYTRTTSRTVSAANSPPSVTIDLPSPLPTWSVGDSITFHANATDAQDGTLPASAYAWTLTMQHCPSDCHSHIIETFSGVQGGTFEAPDHEYPSHLRLSVDVTDSGGLTTHAEVEMFPATGTVSASTSPAGIPITVGAATGKPPPAATGIVNSKVSVSAPATAVVGESAYAFDHWSDGGARTHSVTITPGATSVVATYTRTGAAGDRANTCSTSPAPVTPPGVWLPGGFGSAGDIDWYRFKLTSTTRVRLILGDLTAGGRMSLYSGCTKVLEVSDYGATTPELIIRLLPAGTYAVRLSGSGGTASPAYSFLMQRMPNTVHVLSARARTDAGVFRLVGEVYNNTSHWVGPVTVTGRLYNSSGKLLTTRSARTLLSYVPPRGRIPFSIDGPPVPGFHHTAWSVSAPATSKPLGVPSITVTVNTLNSAGNRVINGTVRNPYSKTTTSFGVAVTLYDGRASVLDAKRSVLGARSLGAGKSTTFKTAFIALGLYPTRTYVRGVIHR